MAGLAIDNLKDNPERFLLLKQKIKKKDDFTLTNKKKVVLDYRDSTIKTIFLADDFDTIKKYIKQPLFIIKATKEELRLSEIEKTAEFGSSKGSGGGTDQTSATESMCCFFAAYLFNGGADKFEKITDEADVSKYYSPLSKFYDLQKNQKLVDTQHKTGSPRFSFEKLWKDTPIDLKWMNTYINTANILKKYLTKFTGTVYFHRGSAFMDAVYEHKRSCHNHDKEMIKGDPNIKRVVPDRFGDDKWNPGDVWISTLKPSVDPIPQPDDPDESKIKTRCDWISLKQQVAKAYKLGKTVGASLKAMKGEAKVSQWNLPEKDRLQNKKVAYKGFKFGAGDFFSSVDMYLVFDGAMECQFRPYNKDKSWQGEMTGGEARGGKVSGGPTNYYSEIFFNKSIGHDSIVGKWSETKFIKTQHLKKMYKLYKLYNEKQTKNILTTIKVPKKKASPYSALSKHWKVKQESGEFEIWESTLATVKEPDFEILADNYTFLGRNVAKNFYFGKYMALLFVDTILGGGSTTQKRNKFSTDIVRYAMSNISDVATYFIKVS